MIPQQTKAVFSRCNREILRELWLSFLCR